MKYILTVIYICLTTAGIFLMKQGGNSLTVTVKNGFAFNIGYITLLGFICYLFSFLLWQKLLTTYDLTYIVPITTGICQVVIMLIGFLIFKEKINWVGIAGAALVIAGVVLIAFSKIMK